ncbi:HNH endonuclease OS=Tsukamurella paurometabola (strain ATCC 8368 / DSM / CCUG 35730 / CIP 100753/ JCM 10117 / KCTC 9821 / NBRC 16120 / NCIMB 702349 / NCTC 13040) OX=521096 GN=Tpau_0390 PE=3 SV=1 [Tsukamurella paurometabola]|uniref:HNH endonuclease n=1 Tax=Tsukamurella paurometabola (strain ATCC 8368 / DSM 20162 / CCUG 35730 / CIP 100753 / JCM 10117 / KCTC 9821 / NBRC 16120 / NCIMB 702349 / NCTC 13040) TaxID=521096 RepID=D5URH8_TSUPD|nr:HNH endonuclease signature motif containing protein [Tsukamurella paurometabola]ADG77031.1 HNH endonuclease [Tsukamurella paurometabola DSM 20162]SUP42532.1 HNH endonuclease [Tsukamurella paurometabola]
MEEEDIGTASGAGGEVIAGLSALERLRARVVFDQYRLIVELLRARVCERIAAGAAQDRWEAGVASEVALALRVSTNRATAMLSRAKVLARDLPATFARLREGDVSPEAVEVIVAGVSHLEPRLKTEADTALCGENFAAGGLGLKRLQDTVKQVAYRLDAQATVDRVALAAKDRRVTVRPAPDCMARVSILLPVAQAVGVYAALKTAADAVFGVPGEPRSRGQIMADTAFARITGREAAEGQPVTVNLTVPASVLLGDQPGAAHLSGGGTLPGEIARHLVGRAAEQAIAWVKRLYVQPESGAVVGLDSRSRLFPRGLAEVIAARDRYCRTPYCDAPIAHTDHIAPHAHGGPTSLANGQGLCAACNYAKEAAGWSSRTVDDETGRHTVETHTPTGHVHRSTAPPQAA